MSKFEIGVEQLMDRAIHELKRGNHAGAADLLRKVLTREPNNVKALLWLSRCLTNNDKRIELAERATSLEPSNQKAAKALAYYRSLGEKDTGSAPVPVTPKVFVAVVGSLAAVGALVACGLVASAMLAADSSASSRVTPTPWPTPPCDLEDALSFESELSNGIGEAISALHASTYDPSLRTQDHINDGLATVFAWKLILDDPAHVPACYDGLLKESLRLDRLALDHVSNGFGALRTSNTEEAERQLDAAVEAANESGDRFLYGICIYEIEDMHIGYSMACDRIREQE